MSEQARLGPKERVPIAPPVGFEPTGADLHLSFESQPRLSYGVRLDRSEYIELSTDEKNLHALNGYFNVLPETGESGKDDRKGIGCISYVPASDEYPACYEVRVLVPKVKFDELVAAARLGRLPSIIWIHVEGMKFGGAPDGSHKKWDNKAFPRLDVTSIDFTVPLITQAISSERPTPSDEVSPPTHSQFNDLLVKTNTISEKLDRVVIEIRNVLWAVLVIGVLMLILRILR